MDLGNEIIRLMFTFDLNDLGGVTHTELSSLEPSDGRESPESGGCTVVSSQPPDWSLSVWSLSVLTDTTL